MNDDLHVMQYATEYCIHEDSVHSMNSILSCPDDNGEVRFRHHAMANPEMMTPLGTP